MLLTGVAGLLAGALSMAAGEFVSVRSQRELLAASAPDSATPTTSLRHLDLDANELALVYRARGMARRAGRPAPRVLPRSAAPAASRVPDRCGPTCTRRRDGLGRRGLQLLFFASGAAIPVLPFLFGLDGGPAVLVAAVLVGLALLSTGATVGLLSGGPPLRRGAPARDRLPRP